MLRCYKNSDLLDFTATAAEVAGAEIPAGQAEDSISILPLMKGENPSPRDHIIHHSGCGIFALRKGDWKVIFETEGSGGWPWPKGSGPVMGSRGQVYNLKEDPKEERNLWKERPDIIAECSTLLMKSKGLV